VEEFTERINTLAGIVGQEFIKPQPDIIAKYAVDNTMPKVVLFPASTQQVADVVRYANQENLAIVPWGRGSKMAMGLPSRRLDMVVCTSRMNHMTDVDSANLTITVEAGVKFRDIQARLATQEDRCYLPLKDLVTEADEMICLERENQGCFVPMDAPFSESATIGGIVATNSSGPRRLIYGLPRDMVLGVRFVAPNGDIVGTGGKTVKNVSGYDISKLMIGSAGTLGILCEMTLRLLPLPEAMETLLVSFDSFSDASGFVERIFETALTPAAVEVMNSVSVKGLKRDWLPNLGSGGYVVAVALEGFEEAVARMHTEMKDMAASLGAKGDASLQEDKHRIFWLAVSNLLPAMTSRFSGLISAQLNYPISEWRKITEFAENALSARNIEYSILVHSGCGVCLINLLMDKADSDVMRKGIEAMGSLLARCYEAGGNLVVQSAPVDVKQDLPVWGEARPDFLVVKRIKELLDPSGIMSPGRFVGGL
jgi:glycolate oxidase FAD binding subunit